ncbi:MAG TPA: SET domain-containing protein-lysine N-methyltransferase [Candidatus Paceibacterota bacterium]
MKDLDIKKSRNGLGIFTKRDFYPEEKIFEVKGSFISCNEEDDLDEKTRANTFRFDKEKYISPEGRIGDYLNHSCTPNSKVSKIVDNLFVVAVENIKKGSEVTIDYSTILAADDYWEMDCNCGSTDCRGLVKKFNSLPSSIKDKYISSNMVPDYIL